MNHKKLEAWENAMELVKQVYKVTESFPKNELFGLTSQMRRCAVSIPSNIAEGAARNSDRDFIRFLHIALGSLSELETQVLISKEIELLKDVRPLEIQIFRVRRPIQGLIKYLQSKPLPP